MDSPIFGQPAEDIVYMPEEPAAGISGVSGFAEGSFSYGRASAGDDSANIRSWALRGSVNADLGTGFNTQVDAGYNRGDISDLGQANTLGGTLHAYYREPDAFAFGGFVSASRFGSTAFNLLHDYLDADKYATDLIGGLEGAVYTSDATLYGRAGYGRVSYSDIEADHLTAALGARVYANDDTRYDFEGAFNRLSAYGVDADLYSLSAIANYRFTGTPVTAFAGYRYDRATVEDSNPLTAHRVLTGLRVHFGSNSLKEEERRGPAWASPALSF
ncbi:hypothetical protein GCM10011491_40850 [Brucella endophytica]|uniref:Uncharacterized protein n=1 Tax=Brucella endophytica TaxID=1963359 RepID=A0A916WL93_9HYPH|nr:hypothetical protein [Brucella endophytica]GGB08630.1 hypothetical protein GCM10011491_40850 [Brucella endophytica]